MRAQPAKLQGSHAGATAHYAASPYRAAGARHLTPDTEALYTAKTYDPEQHVYPNQVRSGVSAALPGSAHPLVFEDDENGPYVYQPGVSGSRVESDSQPTLTDVDVFLWAHVRKSGAGATMQIVGQWGSAGSKAARLIETASAGLAFQHTTDGSTVTSTTLTAEPSWWTAGATAGWVGVFYDVSEGDLIWYDGGTDTTPTWASVETDAIGVVSISDESTGTAVTVASDNTPGGARFIGRVYSAGIGASTSSLDDFGRFDAAMFIPGNRGHGAEATDVQGNTWTVSRAGSPLSVIDDGDGNGKRVRFTGTSLNYLKSNQTPNLSGGDFFAWAWMSSTRDANRVLLAQYGTATERSWWLRDSFGTPQFVISTDGTADSSLSTLAAVPTWYSSNSVGWLGVFYDHSEGDLVWYDGGSGTSPSWSAVETDAVGVLTMFNSGSQITVGSILGGTENWSGDVFEAGIGASTSSLYDYSHFDAAQINRHQWRCDNTVDTGSGPTGETWTVTYTDSAEDANDPPVLWHYGDDYVYLPGTASNYLSLPDDADLEVVATDVLQITLDVASLDWTPSSVPTLIGKYLTTGNQRSWRVDLLATGALRVWVSSNGTATNSADSSALPLVDSQRSKVRITWTIGTGFAVEVSDDGVTFTTVDASVALADVPFDSSATLDVSGFNAGASQSWNGKLYSATVTKNSANVASINPSDAASANGTSWTDSVSGNTVTINRATSGFATEVVKAPVAITGESHYIQVPYDAAISDFPLTAALGFRLHSTTSTWFKMLTNETSSVTQDGWAIQKHDSNERVYGRADDGTSEIGVGDASDNITYSTRSTFVFAAAAADQEGYLDGASLETTSTSLATIDQGSVITIGARSDGSAPTPCMAFFNAVILSSRLSDAEALALHNELLSVSASGHGYSDGFDDGFG